MTCAHPHTCRNKKCERIVLCPSFVHIHIEIISVNIFLKQIQGTMKDAKSIITAPAPEDAVFATQAILMCLQSEGL